MDKDLEAADAMSDKQYIRNQKKIAKREIRPHGQRFKAVAKLKDCTDRHDVTLIYRCNDVRLKRTQHMCLSQVRLKQKLQLTWIQKLAFYARIVCTLGLKGRKM